MKPDLLKNDLKLLIAIIMSFVFIFLETEQERLSSLFKPFYRFFYLLPPPTKKQRRITVNCDIIMISLYWFFRFCCPTDRITQEIDGVQDARSAGLSLSLSLSLSL